MSRLLLVVMVLASACGPGASPAATTPSIPGAGVTRIGSMGLAKSSHTATLLADGSVLIAGGYDGACRVREVERFRPSSGTFAPAAPLGVARCGHAAIRLTDGRVLVIGGWTGQDIQATAEIYDPSRDRWTATGSLSVPRADPTATALRDGSILVAGGFDGRTSLRTAERYDPVTGSFSAVRDLGVPRTAHTATPLADGRVLITGGSSGRGIVESTAEIYDPASGSFAPTGQMLVRRHKHGAAPLPDGRVLIVGGSDERDFGGRYMSAEIFDPRTGTFAATAPMSMRRFKLPLAVVALPAGEVLVAGGGTTAEIFEADSFSAVRGTFGAPLAFAAAAVLADGSVLITGGYDELIRPTSGAWLFRR